MPASILEYCNFFFSCSFNERSFAAKFGVDVVVCNYLYARVSPLGLSKHELLLTLNYLKCYNTSDSIYMEWKCSERHYRTTVAKGIQTLLAGLDEVSFAARAEIDNCLIFPEFIDSLGGALIWKEI
jgi:hypothetical protein